MTTTRLSLLAACATAAVLLGSCSSPTGTEETGTPGGTETSAPQDSPTDGDSPTDDGTTDGGDECYVHLFDSEDLDASDDNVKLTEPGKYEDLSALPGADADWTDEADSIRVGADATVTIWAEVNFEGASQQLDPGSEHSEVEPEPSSLEMSCE